MADSSNAGGDVSVRDVGRARDGEASEGAIRGGVGGQPKAAREKREEGAHVSYVGQDVEAIPPEVVERYKSTARRLDLSYNKLKSVVGIEQFSCLEELVLDNNELTDSSLALPLLPRLHTLTLNKNQIRDIDRLLATLTKACPNLKYLSLLGNQACPNELLGSGHDDEDYQRYRYFVIHKLPGLTFLDSRAVSGGERKEAKRVGAFMRVVRPPDETFSEASKVSKETSSGQEYTPLPASTDTSGNHRGVFGQCKYVYYGKHSEGNRFIRNNQL
ncbi:Leucine-rich melanocyte differentiation-associated protein [Geodia barretti]|uniref:Leucine-rich melanocyte differentiation-associated protein n=1 Tax=Geodia barretti TaxID=519541 RepID=A0AA35S417_GEOBA|nr:Leucine-rich melanocyte differentiation-associated protein [Geodia barretti]